MEVIFKLCSIFSDNKNSKDGNERDDTFHDCGKSLLLEESLYGNHAPNADSLKLPRYEELFDDLFCEMCMRLDDKEDWSGYLQSEDWLLSDEKKESNWQCMSTESGAVQEEGLDSTKPASPPASGGKSFGAFLKRHKLDFVFYALLIALIVSFFSFRAKGGPVLMGGFGVFTVATDSMSNVLPQGCLIVTKHIDPNLLAVGDDITFMNGPTSTVTHRIIGIKEVSEENEILQFYTQGTMNAEPDLVPVAAHNVVGKVVYSSLPMGHAVQFVRANWPLILVVLLVVCVWGAIMKNLFYSNRKHQHK